MDKKQMTINGRLQQSAYVRAKNGAAKAPEKKWEYRKITQDDAKLLLAKVRTQRTIDERWVLGLRRTMEAGLWDSYAGRAPVAIDSEDKTLNAQHRLTAFIGSTLDTITFLFVTGCHPDEYKSFDIDAKLRGKKYLHPEMPFANRELARLDAYDRLLSGNREIRNTQAVMEHLHQRFHKECDWAAELMPSAGRQGRAPYMASLMYVHKADAAFAERIGKPWVNGGEGLPTVLLRFRDDALRMPGRGGRYDTTRLMLRMLNALALIHQKKALPQRLGDSLAGLKYFSAMLHDGAAKRWDAHAIAGTGALP